MISTTGYGWAVLLILAAGVSVATAQAVPADENPDGAAAETAADANDADIKDLDWSRLNVDASTLTTRPASKTRVVPQAGAGNEMSWSSKDKPNGSAAVSVKQPLAPFWDSTLRAHTA